MNQAQRYRTILLFGAPGSGKGTQGKVLGQIPGFFHLSCGDVFRGLNPTSELGRTFLQYSSQGKLVPDNFTVQLWSEHIHRLVHTHHFHPEGTILLLDGIPRNRHQAEMMDQYIEVLMVLYLEAVDQEQMIARLRRRALHENRLDDANEEVIRGRFREYAAESTPVLDFYPLELIRKVDAGLSPLQVLRQAIDAIEEGIFQAAAQPAAR